MLTNEQIADLSQINSMMNSSALIIKAEELIPSADRLMEADALTALNKTVEDSCGYIQDILAASQAA